MDALKIGVGYNPLKQIVLKKNNCFKMAMV